MIRHISVACLVLVQLGISGHRTHARIIGLKEFQKFSHKGEDFEPDIQINARLPNDHISVSVGGAAPPSHNGVDGVVFDEGGIVVNIINSGDGSEAQAHAPKPVPATPQTQAQVPAPIEYQGVAGISIPVEPVGHTPSPIPFQFEAGSSAVLTPQVSSKPPTQNGPYAVPNTHLQQPGLAPDACDCQCLCPFHFFNTPAVNLAASMLFGSETSPTTLATVASPAFPASSILNTTTAGSSFPPEIGVVTDSAVSPTLSDVQAFATLVPVQSFLSSESEVQTSSIEAPGLPPVVLPEPSEDVVVVTTGLPVAPEGDATPSEGDFATPNQPPTAVPTETAMTSAEAMQPPAAEVDVTQPATTEATATTEVPPTVTDADFTQELAENANDSATATTPEAAETDADSAQPATPEPPEETPAPDPAVDVPIDVGTMALYSALTLRLGA
ncbi:uncharacterized protein PADG_02487 [Paracoccidioides brasiliensis Pb18]|uniref:Uncharacterized protein n=1 Tax=Paracoccidioides brasiliensis (strain Pb18) TaxID=502780 RepID=C1G5N2_PARBD|nr:uncharacterized protein PADG_02487 [Paracoccidioides brasiliensis Pb18]EEH46389.1 hypothetical protein PADG_02487 [Paracoccidioides brasiliensis Pb18]